MSERSDLQPAASGTRWAVATPHTAASDAAAEVLRTGGNAVDAALAAAAVLTVVYPNQCSVGGDLLALVGTAGGDVRFVNSSGRAPQAADVRSLSAGHDVMPVDGALPVTVPGVVAGWAALAENWGTRPLAAALAPAEAAARDGVAVSPGLISAPRHRNFSRRNAEIRKTCILGRVRIERLCTLVSNLLYLRTHFVWQSAAAFGDEMRHVGRDRVFLERLRQLTIRDLRAGR